MWLNRRQRHAIKPADQLSPDLPIPFLCSAAGMTAAFVAMNHAFGDFFMVARADTLDIDAATAARARLAGQFVVDVHFPMPRWISSRSLRMGRMVSRSR